MTNPKVFEHKGVVDEVVFLLPEDIEATSVSNVRISLDLNAPKDKSRILLTIVQQSYFSRFMAATEYKLKLKF